MAEDYIENMLNDIINKYDLIFQDKFSTINGEKIQTNIKKIDIDINEIKNEVKKLGLSSRTGSQIKYNQELEGLLKENVDKGVLRSKILEIVLKKYNEWNKKFSESYEENLDFIFTKGDELYISVKNALRRWKYPTNSEKLSDIQLSNRILILKFTTNLLFPLCDISKLVNGKTINTENLRDILITDLSKLVKNNKQSNVSFPGWIYTEFPQFFDKKKDQGIAVNSDKYTTGYGSKDIINNNFFRTRDELIFLNNKRKNQNILINDFAFGILLSYIKPTDIVVKNIYKLFNDDIYELLETEDKHKQEKRRNSVWKWDSKGKEGFKNIENFSYSLTNEAVTDNENKFNLYEKLTESLLLYKKYGDDSEFGDLISILHKDDEKPQIKRRERRNGKTRKENIIDSREFKNNNENTENENRITTLFNLQKNFEQCLEFTLAYNQDLKKSIDDIISMRLYYFRKMLEILRENKKHILIKYISKIFFMYQILIESYDSTIPPPFRTIETKRKVLKPKKIIEEEVVLDSVEELDDFFDEDTEDEDTEDEDDSNNVVDDADEEIEGYEEFEDEEEIEDSE